MAPLLMMMEEVEEAWFHSGIRLTDGNIHVQRSVWGTISWAVCKKYYYS